jgi:tRNA1(Val) A37 N6-methylase TrmN6
MSSPTTKRPEVAPEGATTDDFLGGRISVVQPPRGHRAGSDAVFLAAAVPAQSGDRVLDAGAGVGVAGLCILSRVPGVRITAVEIDPDLCGLAASNAERNGFAAQVKAVHADVTASGKVLSAAGLKRESYDQLMANPPFHAEGRVRGAPDPSRASAHVMQKGGLAAWMRFFAAMAAPGALLTLIHRPESLAEILQLIAGRFGGVTIFPLYPMKDEAAVRIIVQAKKGSRAAPILLPGMVLHRTDGSYTEEAERVLRGGDALALDASGNGKGRRLGG